jgi:hypothetical protein
VALPARRIIESARDRHPAFDHRRTPDPSALRFLSDYRKELAGRVAQINENLLAVEQTVAMPLVSFDAGITLNANRLIVGVVARDTSVPPVTINLDLLPWAQRLDSNTPMAACWQVNGVLYLRSPANMWNNIVQIGILMVPVLGDLATMDDDTGLPVEAARALTENVAYYMAKRSHVDPAIPAIPLAQFYQDAKIAEQEFLFDIGNRQTTTHFRTRDVWRPGYYGPDS